MAKVAIVGRPNVGKSTLFNRLLGRREAIVADFAGVTRDVKEAEVVSDDGKHFTLLDTGGLWSGDEWEHAIETRVREALRDVEVVLFCVDGRDGLAAADHEIARFLRSIGKPVMVVATKVDDPRHEEAPAYFELHGLGFGEPFPTAAEHARGTWELLAAVAERLVDDEGEADDHPIRVAIVGRPNVGKSSLLNALLGEERVIVADVPGTTRDTIDVRFEYGGRSFILIDTAGLRRKADGDVEYYASLRSEEATRRADVAVLVVDPATFGDHEMRVGNIALEHGVPVVMAVNKWDLVEDAALEPTRKALREALVHLAAVPRIETSALTSFGLHELLAAAVRVYDQARQRVSTGVVNRWIDVWTQRQTPPNFKGTSLKVYYGSQVEVAPPTFVFSVNNERYVTRAYEQYLRNRLREDLHFAEVPIRTVFKARGRREGNKRVRT